jgi:hypothetical protein
MLLIETVSFGPTRNRSLGSDMGLILSGSFGSLADTVRKTKIGCPNWDAQRATSRGNYRMTKATFPSDAIAFKISTGDNSAGNGGDGYNSGKITSNPSIEFEPSNKAEGSDVHVNTGDNVYQKAYWDAGGANAEAEKYAKAEKHAEPEKYANAEGGTAKSNGDQESYSGHDKSDVDANTKAYQEKLARCGPESEREGRHWRRRRKRQQGGRWGCRRQGQYRVE